MLTIILIVVLLLWLGGYFGYGRSRWGWGPHGDIGTVILVFIILVVLFNLR